MNFFKELVFKSNVAKILNNFFKKEEVINEIGKEVLFKTQKNKNLPTYPCVFISIINNTNNTKYATPEDGQRYTDLIIQFEVFSKELPNYTKEDATTLVGEKLIEGFCTELSLVDVTLNQPMPNIDETISRRMIQISCTIDNYENKIYAK